MIYNIRNLSRESETETPPVATVRSRGSRARRACVLALSLCTVRAGAQPAPPGLPANVQQRIEQAIKSEMARDNIPGLSIAVAVDGVVRWADGYGLADLEHLLPAKVPAMFRPCS